MSFQTEFVWGRLEVKVFKVIFFFPHNYTHYIVHCVRIFINPYPFLYLCVSVTLSTSHRIFLLFLFFPIRHIFTSMASRIKQLQTDADFPTELNNAGSKLVVVDFFATWYVSAGTEFSFD